VLSDRIAQIDAAFDSSSDDVTFDARFRDPQEEPLQFVIGIFAGYVLLVHIAGDDVGHLHPPDLAETKIIDLALLCCDTLVTRKKLMRDDGCKRQSANEAPKAAPGAGFTRQ